MEESRSSRTAAPADQRARRAATWFRIRRWALAGGAAVFAVLWITTALTSHHSTPLYNDWLVILVLYAVFCMLAMPQIVFHRPSESVQRPERKASVLRTTTAYLVAFFGGIWVIGFPMQYAEVSPVASITQIDGREVAIISYNRIGPRGLLQMAFGIESERVVAVDLDTGGHIWDVQTSETAFDRPSVLGDDGEYVYVENSAGTHALRLSDGSADDARRPDDDIADAWTTADAAPTGTETEAAIGNRFVSVKDDILSTSNDDEVWTEIGHVDQVDTDTNSGLDTETTIVVDPIVHRRSTLTVYDDGYGLEQAEAVGSNAGYIVVQQEVYLGPARYDRLLRTIDLATGRTIDEISVPEGARGGMTADSGSSIVTLDGPMMSTTDLIMISPEGKLTQSTIGRSGFFSEAL